MRKIIGNIEIGKSIRVTSVKGVTIILDQNDGWRLPNANEMGLFQWMSENEIGEFGYMMWYRFKASPRSGIFRWDFPNKVMGILLKTTVVLVRDIK